VTATVITRPRPKAPVNGGGVCLWRISPVTVRTTPQDDRRGVPVRDIAGLDYPDISSLKSRIAPESQYPITRITGPPLAGFRAAAKVSDR
jgi:hypothetical protein